MHAPHTSKGISRKGEGILSFPQNGFEIDIPHNFTWRVKLLQSHHTSYSRTAGKPNKKVDKIGVYKYYFCA